MSTIFDTIRSGLRLKVLIPAAVMVAGAVGAYAMVATAPKSQKQRPATVRPLVETQAMTPENYQVWVSAMGTVSAARQIDLKAQVTGEVKSVAPSFVPGGYFREGDTVLSIDLNDYELALEEVRAEVTEAQYNLKVEQGYQNVAGREWDLLKDSTRATEAESELALRKPHLEKAKADLKAAQAKLRQAQVDLQRTRITAPFSAMVEEKSVDIGAVVSEQESLATLVGTDEFWITASVPVDRLDWITIPYGETEGSLVRIRSGNGANASVRTGRVFKLLPSLESEGRMARVVIAVKDPLNLAGLPDVKPLLLGSYVSVEIDGGTLENVYAIPRTAYRDNGKVWLLAQDNTLDIHEAAPVWRDKGTIVFDKGFSGGETIVVSDLSAPVQGMAVQTMKNSQPNTDSEMAEASEVNDEQ
ncbi:efflux RND transporter periplasmic adaptor subunit [Salidesulfovibrio onnuriiensis]|uniref:efflux RND transporter periplasmic adaptor subunit n=1 Tax=Salidesulfovibrio onnuriiensis TaxID=2583823 RepID=UPI0011CBCAC1|nr:efflux RND transporter periplasmic adaptor subunit [Salidesulfovibrio onnuriiensis]